MKRDELLSRKPAPGEYGLATADASTRHGLERGTMFAEYAPKVFAAARLCFAAMPIVFYHRG